MQNANFNLGGMIDPSITTDQLALARNQAMAQALQQQGMTSIDANRNYKISPYEGLAKLAQVLAAGKMNQSNDKSQAALSQKNMQALASMLGGNPAATQQAPQSPQMVPDANMESQGQNAYVPPPQALTQSSQAPHSSGNLDMAALLRGSAMGQLGGEHAASAYYDQFKNPESVKTWLAQGIDPASMKATTLGAAQKAAIMEMQPGTTSRNLATGEERFQPTVSPNTRLNPNGSVSTLPGAVQAIGDIKGAEEGVKLIDVPIGNGRTMKMTQAQYLASTNGQPSPQMVTAASSDVPFVSSVSPNGNTQFAIQGQGRQGGQGGQFGVSDPISTAAAQKFAENRASAAADYGKVLDEKVAAGLDMRSRMEELRNANQLFKPGMGAEVRMQVARAAKSLGMSDATVNSINQGDIGAKQEFQKLAAQSAMESLKLAMNSGRITQAEFLIFLKNNPNMELEQNGLDRMFNFADKQHIKNFNEQQSYDKYINVDKQDASRFPAYYANQQMQIKSNSVPDALPFSPAMTSQPQQTQSQRLTPQEQAELNQLKRKYGR